MYDIKKPVIKKAFFTPTSVEFMNVITEYFRRVTVDGDLVFKHPNVAAQTYFELAGEGIITQFEKDFRSVDESDRMGFVRSYLDNYLEGFLLEQGVKPKDDKIESLDNMVLSIDDRKRVADEVFPNVIEYFDSLTRGINSMFDEPLKVTRAYLGMVTDVELVKLERAISKLRDMNVRHNIGFKEVLALVSPLERSSVIDEYHMGQKDGYLRVVEEFVKPYFQKLAEMVSKVVEPTNSKVLAIFAYNKV